jgi:hypothetical protein
MSGDWQIDPESRIARIERRPFGMAQQKHCAPAVLYHLLQHWDIHHSSPVFFFRQHNAVPVFPRRPLRMENRNADTYIRLSIRTD